MRVPGIVVFCSSFFSSICMSIVSNALERSKATSTVL